MNNLKILEQDTVILDMDDFEIIETKFDIKFPKDLREFVFKYEGAFLGSLYYNGKPVFKEVLVLLKNENFASIEAIMEGHSLNQISGFIPFAIDSGGWDYNISINEPTFGQVWVNKFDGGDDDTMVYVAPSLEDFINGLKPDV